jgi:cytochrome c heme-lyase
MQSADDASKSGGGCPVKQNSPADSAAQPRAGGVLSSLRGWWAGSAQQSSTTTAAAAAAATPAQTSASKQCESGSCPVSTTDAASSSSSSSSTGSCPVGSTSGAYNPLVGDYKYGQARQPGQKVPLDTHRQRSTIPKGEVTPQHQPAGHGTWVYPSEQQYFNAMKRKGWDAQPEDVPVVLAIHNAVNEQGWAKVREWEALRGDAEPKLKEFRGRPTDISPKAWFKSNVLGYKPPFDRHDWVVESGGREVRYVIDFYAGKGANAGAVALHLDVRPALDSVDAALHRARMFVKEDLGFTVFDSAAAATTGSTTSSSSSSHTFGRSSSSSGGCAAKEQAPHTIIDDRPPPPGR